MLRSRLITALVLAPIIVFGILKLPPLWFAVAWGVVIFAAFWEWTDLAGLQSRTARLGFVAVMLAGQLSARYWAPYALDWLAWPVVVWWFALGMALRTFPETLLKIRYPAVLKAIIGLLVLLTAWIIMVWLRVNFGVKQVLFLLLLIWLADAAAYFVGKRFGHTKLLPQISPGKTVEGVYGALFAAAAFAAAVGFYFEFKPIMISDFVVMSLLTVVISVAGDLFESLAKRLRGVKDSGVLFPGHGGVLDRIDSLTAAVSVFYLGSFLREIYL
ncbi:MAG: phosphatidate cytidylyltransferase [Methylotetracoccus sp.]|jgi:phosphatidate cytidylyltransferase|nr:phosphatidate cytidylyltransferase [Methylotetracoccus sp.]